MGGKTTARGFQSSTPTDGQLSNYLARVGINDSYHKRVIIHGYNQTVWVMVGVGDGKGIVVGVGRADSILSAMDSAGLAVAARRSLRPRVLNRRQQAQRQVRNGSASEIPSTL